MHAEPETEVLADHIAGDVVDAGVGPAPRIAPARHVQQQKLGVLGQRNAIDVDFQRRPPTSEARRVVVANAFLEGPYRELVDV
jgi:hypothetical protein